MAAPFLKLTLHHQGETEQQDGSFFPTTHSDLRAVVLAGATGFLESQRRGRALSRDTEIFMKAAWYMSGRADRTFIRTDEQLRLSKELAEPRRARFVCLHAEFWVKWPPGEAEVITRPK
jgi:hypothetical protein